MPTYEAGADGAWHHKGWLSVAPGDSPDDPTIPDAPVTPTDPGTPTVPTGRRLRFYTTDLISNGVAPGTGGGTGGGTTPVPTGSTYFGAEPSPAGNGTTNQQQLINKFGGRPSTRQFLGTNWTSLPVHIAGISVAQWSWSPQDANVISGSLDDAIAAHVAAMKNGDIFTYAHESDNDGLTAAQTTDRIAAMNRCYDICKATKPGVYVAPTHTGYMFSPNNPGAAAKQTLWSTVKGDLLGVDFDGVHAADADGSYAKINYKGHIPNVKAYLTKYKAKGWIGWTIPEWATSRITSFDPDGTKRAAWISDQGAAFVTGGAYACQYFDHAKDAGDTTASINTIANPSPELTALKQLVASNPANPA